MASAVLGRVSTDALAAASVSDIYTTSTVFLIQGGILTTLCGQGVSRVVRSLSCHSICLSVIQAFHVVSVALPSPMPQRRARGVGFAKACHPDVSVRCTRSFAEARLCVLACATSDQPLARAT